RVEPRIGPPVRFDDAGREQPVPEARREIQQPVRVAYERAEAFGTRLRAGGDGGERLVEAGGREQGRGPGERRTEAGPPGPAHGSPSIARGRLATQTAASPCSPPLAQEGSPLGGGGTSPHDAQPPRR